MGHLSLRKKNKFGLSLFIPAWTSQIFTVKTGGKRSPFWGSVISLVLKTSTKMMINLPEIFDRNCPLRGLYRNGVFRA